MANKEGAQIDTLPSQQYGWDGTKPERISVEGGAVVVRNLTADIKWDKILPAPTATEDVYIFSVGGVTTSTITIHYTDSTKETISPTTGITRVDA